MLRFDLFLMRMIVHLLLHRLPQLQSNTAEPATCWASADHLPRLSR